MDSQTAALCLLLMGWWSFHVAIRKWISASDQLGERLLVPALFTLLESSSTRLELWYWVMTIVGKSDRVNMGCCSKNSLCQSGKMYGPRTASPTLASALSSSKWQSPRSTASSEAGDEHLAFSELLFVRCKRPGSKAREKASGKSNQATAKKERIKWPQLQWYRVFRFFQWKPETWPRLFWKAGWNGGGKGTKKPGNGVCNGQRSSKNL